MTNFAEAIMVSNLRPIGNPMSYKPTEMTKRVQANKPQTNIQENLRHLRKSASRKEIR